MMTRPRRSPLARGFSLIEALIALVVTSFGLLAIAGVGLKLAHSEDVARQRGEATRLAQEQIENFRSFTQLAAEPGRNAWASMGGATTSDEIINGADYSTNTVFKRSWQVFDSVDDPWRRVSVTVAWADRVKGDAEPQSITFNSIISKTDPFDSGALAFPLPGNTTLKRPKNRSLNIPVPATDLGNGQSVVQMGSFAVVFDNAAGWVVKTCEGKVVKTVADLETGCIDSNAYIVAGYVSLSGTSSFPAGLDINAGLVSGSEGVICHLEDAKDQNDAPDSAAVIAGYKYYLCVVRVATKGAEWGGTIRLAAPGLNSGTNYLVCRFQYAPLDATPSKVNNPKNVQPYTQVGDSLDNQNYVITTANSCPTIDSLQTKQHQNCRSSNPNNNELNRGTDCPATKVP